MSFPMGNKPNGVERVFLSQLDAAPKKAMPLAADELFAPPSGKSEISWVNLQVSGCSLQAWGFETISGQSL